MGRVDCLFIFLDVFFTGRLAAMPSSDMYALTNVDAKHEAAAWRAEDPAVSSALSIVDLRFSKSDDPSKYPVSFTSSSRH